MSEKVTIKVERKELHLPTIALRGLVVFPNNLVHFEVGREKSIAAVEWAMANNSNVFLVAQKEMETSEPTQQDLYTYGVVAGRGQVPRQADRTGYHRRFSAVCRALRSGACRKARRGCGDRGAAPRPQDRL